MCGTWWSEAGSKVKDRHRESPERSWSQEARGWGGEACPAMPLSGSPGQLRPWENPQASRSSHLWPALTSSDGLLERPELSQPPAAARCPAASCLSGQGRGRRGGRPARMACEHSALASCQHVPMTRRRPGGSPDGLGAWGTAAHPPAPRAAPAPPAPGQVTRGGGGMPSLGTGGAASCQCLPSRHTRCPPWLQAWPQRGCHTAHGVCSCDSSPAVWAGQLGALHRGALEGGAAGPQQAALLVSVLSHTAHLCVPSGGRDAWPHSSPWPGLPSAMMGLELNP